MKTNKLLGAVVVAASLVIGTVCGHHVITDYKSYKSKIDASKPIRITSFPADVIYRVNNNGTLIQFIDYKRDGSLDEVVVMGEGKKQILNQGDKEFEQYKKMYLENILPEYR